MQYHLRINCARVLSNIVEIVYFSYIDRVIFFVAKESLRQWRGICKGFKWARRCQYLIIILRNVAIRRTLTLLTRWFNFCVHWIAGVENEKTGKRRLPGDT